MERFSYNRNGGVDLSCSVRVSVPSFSVVDGKTYYTVKMKTVKTNPMKQWQVTHRYSEFLALKETLAAHLAEQTDMGKACPGCQHYMTALGQFAFPRKHLFSSNSAIVIKYRQVSLHAFVSMLASHTFTTTPRCPTCSGYAFELVRDFFTGNSAAETTMESPGKDTSIRHALAVDHFVQTHAVATGIVVDSNGGFVSSPPKLDPGKPVSGGRPPRATRSSPPKPPVQVQPTTTSRSRAPTESPRKPRTREAGPLDVDRYSFESGVPIEKPRREDAAVPMAGLRISEVDEDEDLNMDFLPDTSPRDERKPVVRQVSQPLTL